jgi:3-oxoacyl-[acyl-carrier-protein] synthase-1
MKIPITGRGLVTPLGNGLKANLKALRTGVPGTVFVPEWEEMNLQSCVGGLVNMDFTCPILNKNNLRFSSPNSKMAIYAAYEAVIEAGLTPEELSGKRVAVILGCGGSSFITVFEGAQILLKTEKVKRVSPFAVTKIMNSCAAANISLTLKLTGESYSISSACTSSAHSIITAVRLIKDGLYDMVITGGSEETSWLNALGFDAMRALTRTYNDTPEKASRPFDKDRTGFVIAEGAGILILEHPDHAEARGADPKAFISGIATNSNAYDMVVPSAEFSAELMNNAIKNADLNLEDISYINAHGTSTPTGDPVELDAVKLLFQDQAGNIPVSSTKSLTGHMIGATGAVEAIYSTIMMENNFIAPTANMKNTDEGYEWADLVPLKPRENVSIKHTLSNSFGVGGTNGSLVISKA